MGLGGAVGSISGEQLHCILQVVHSGTEVHCWWMGCQSSRLLYPGWRWASIVAQPSTEHPITFLICFLFIIERLRLPGEVTRHWNPILWLALVTTMKIHQVSIRSECWWYQPEYLSGQKCPFAQCCSLRVPLISQWLKIVQELLHRQLGLIRSCKLNWMVYNHQQTPHF